MDELKWEVLPINSSQRISVHFISVNSENRQGIRIAIDAGNGTLETNGVVGKAFDLWEDECPEQTGNIYRYYCNNAKRDQEFDKLVFEIELL